MSKSILKVVVLLVVFAGGAWLAKWFYSPAKVEKTEDSSVLLQRIENVSKLVTVEGYFAEVYDYKDYKWYDFSFLSKKALIRVKAKVSAGYDMSKMKIAMNPDTRVVHISNLPEPTILSIDEDLDYYDVNQGMFNSFTAEDYTKLNQNAKEYIRTQAQKSGLIESARTQGNKMLDVIRMMSESMGWKVEMEGSPVGAGQLIK